MRQVDGQAPVVADGADRRPLSDDDDSSDSWSDSSSELDDGPITSTVSPQPAPGPSNAVEWKDYAAFVSIEQPQPQPAPDADTEDPQEGLWVERKLTEVLQELAHLNLTGKVRHGQQPLRWGGFSEVYKGVLVNAPLTVSRIRRRRKDGGNPGEKGPATLTVAVKRFRLITGNDEDLCRTISRELSVWSQLHHPNVIPLLGYVLNRGFPALVSEWMFNGTSREYLEVHPDIDRFKLIRDVAGGLAYLHSKGVIHSDLKSDNVLMSNEGVPMLTDFGISRIYDGVCTITGTSNLHGTWRWMAPELMENDAGDASGNHFHTAASDVWAFGMVIYEVLTGHLPYDTLSDAQAISAISKKILPWTYATDLKLKPPEAKLRRLSERCCSARPIVRPSTAVIFSEMTLGRIPNAAPAIVPTRKVEASDDLDDHPTEDPFSEITETINCNEIVDADLFWSNELMRVNDDLHFVCFVREPKMEERKLVWMINGFVTNRAYYILKAVEYNGERFLKIRNPWGQAEWDGAWSDLSRNWTSEWRPALELLDHNLGDRSAFIMEYGDFLAKWDFIERTQMVDQAWTVSSCWLNVDCRPIACAWQYGDVSFTFSLPKSTDTAIVLSHVDRPPGKNALVTLRWVMDFKLFEAGGRFPIASSAKSVVPQRSATLRKELGAGDFVVHVRIGRKLVWKKPDTVRYCHDCNSGEKIDGVRWECPICEDYELCDQCHGTGTHTHHKMEKVEGTGEEVEYTEDATLAESRKIHIGLRVCTSDGTAVDVAGQRSFGQLPSWGGFRAR